ncbi:hypothetical protein [Christensenella timonensis]|uniref:hypothetical protein n=1 Tax=Christensenella timonensis TaxID=1816678 RepID=UPI0012E829ED|nr:hypothetical protein [Christensenella timonensis]
MNHLEIVGMILLAAVAAAGVIIKCITRRKLNDMDGISDVFLSENDEKVSGKF